MYTVCQDAAARAKSFLRLKRLGLTGRDYPEVRKVSIWLDEHLWKLNEYTSLRIATHKEWINIDFEPHKQFWKYVNREWGLASEAKIRLDKRNRQLIIYLTFVKEVEEYKPRGYLSVDVNENNVTMLVDNTAFLSETNMKELVLGYYHKKRIQEKHDRVCGGKSRIKRKALKKLKERKKKHDIRWKVANTIVRTAYEERYATAKFLITSTLTLQT